MTKRFYNPWVGSRYATDGYLGRRLLILGESHYDIERSNHSAATTDIISGLAIAGGRNRFCNRLQRLVTGASGVLNQEQRAGFWHRVAFCNFIQTPLPGPRQRPTEEMWAAGSEPLLQTIHELAPQVLLVLGVQLARKLPPVSAAITVCAVRHPSSVGFSYKLWHPKIQAALTASRGA